jgi:hypothetical protein
MDLLPLNAVHVDLVHTDDAAAAARRDAYLALMSPDEHERMGRLIFERDRRRFLLTRALVRTMLSRYAAVRAADWTFVENVHGRPEIFNRPRGVPDLRFNISHTDGLIACAVTIGREVGVDVEHIGRRLTHDVAGRFFAPQEVKDLAILPGTNNRKRSSITGRSRRRTSRRAASVWRCRWPTSRSRSPRRRRRGLRSSRHWRTIRTRGNSRKTGRRRSIASGSRCDGKGAICRYGFVL